MVLYSIIKNELREFPVFLRNTFLISIALQRSVLSRISEIVSVSVILNFYKILIASDREVLVKNN